MSTSEERRSGVFTFGRREFQKLLRDQYLTLHSWVCFVVGRPTSVPDPGSSLPVPKDQKLLQSLVTLARIMSKCVRRVYSQRHESLLPLWNAANEIRLELYQFADQQMKDMDFKLVGDLTPGEQGLCQAMLSTSKMSRRNTRPMLIWCYSVPSHLTPHLSPVSHPQGQAETREPVYWKLIPASVARQCVRALSRSCEKHNRLSVRRLSEELPMQCLSV